MMLLCEIRFWEKNRVMNKDRSSCDGIAGTFFLQISEELRIGVEKIPYSLYNQCIEIAYHLYYGDVQGQGGRL